MSLFPHTLFHYSWHPKLYASWSGIHIQLCLFIAIHPRELLAFPGQAHTQTADKLVPDPALGSLAHTHIPQAAGLERVHPAVNVHRLPTGRVRPGCFPCVLDHFGLNDVRDLLAHVFFDDRAQRLVLVLRCRRRGEVRRGCEIHERPEPPAERGGRCDLGSCSCRCEWGGINVVKTELVGLPSKRVQHMNNMR